MKKFEVNQPKKFEVDDPKKFEIHKKFQIEEKATRYMQDLWDVGPRKALGYLPISTLEAYSNLTEEQLVSELKSRGLEVRVFNKGTFIASGAVFAYHKETLQRLLESNKDILEKNEWPTSADDFVIEVSNHIAQDPSLIELIAKAFGRL